MTRPAMLRTWEMTKPGVPVNVVVNSLPEAAELVAKGWTMVSHISTNISPRRASNAS